MHIFGTTALLNPNHADENLKSMLIESDLEVREDAFFGGAANYAKILNGKVSFVGTAGLIFGHMDVPAANVITVDTSGTANPVEVADDGTVSANDGWEAGELNGTTFAVSDLHYIKIGIAGKYRVSWHFSANTAAGGGTGIHGGIMVDDTATRDNGEDHADVANANDHLSIGGIGVVDCPNGNEEISLWISNDAAQKTIIEHGNMYIELIAGT